MSVLVGVIVLMALALLLYFGLRGSATSTSPGGASPPATPGAPSLGTGPAAPSLDRPATGTVAEPDRRGPADPAATSGPRTAVTETGGVVRDHRRNPTEQVALPAPMPPGQRDMSPVLTAALYPHVTSAVRACARNVAGQAAAEGAIVHVTLLVDIAAETITHAEASAVATGLPDAAAKSVISCMRDRAWDLTVSAKGEPNRDGYVVQFPILVRPPETRATP